MVKPKQMNFTKSEELWSRALKVVPCGTQCLSHGPTQYVTNVSPKYLVRGKGCIVWDADGNKFIDTAPGGYPHILGYAYKPVIKAVYEQMKKGNVFPMMHPLEVEVSELLANTIPCAKMVRFGRNGADVTSMAVRASRAMTGRDKVLAGGYHGSHDWYIATTERNKGIPEAVKKLTLKFEYNDLDGVKRLFEENKDQIAAVILEPVQLSPPKDDYLKKLKDMAHNEGAVLIFDEIITGFRFAMGGAQEYFGVTPDMATFAKAMSNGFPISALVGSEKCMEMFDQGVFFSTTYGGETTGLAAIKATVTELKEKNVIPFIWQQGKKLKDGVLKIREKHNLQDVFDCIGYDCWHVMDFKGENKLINKSLFQQECMKRGILAGLYHGVCYAHKDNHVEKILRVYDDAAKILRKKLDEGKVKESIEGLPIRPVFTSFKK